MSQNVPEKAFKWFSQKMLDYEDSCTTNRLMISLESGVSTDNGWDSYIPPRIKFQIVDSRVNVSKVEISLKYELLDDLVNTFGELIKKGPEKYFPGGVEFGSILFTEYKGNNKKEMILKCLGIDDSYNVSLEIRDASGNSGANKIMKLEHKIFYAVYTLCQQTRNQYSSLSVTFLNNCLQSKILEQLSMINNRPVTAIIQPVSYDVVEPTCEEPIPIPLNGVDVTAAFNNHISGSLDSVNLKEFTLPPENMVAQAIKDAENVAKEMVKKPILHDMPFVGRFLNYRIGMLFDFITQFYMAEEKTQDITFAPLTRIITTSITNDAFAENLATCSSLLKCQYYLNVMCKRGMNSFNTTGKFKLYNTTDFLGFKKIKQGKGDLWALGLEVLVVHLFITYIHQRFIGTLTGDTTAFRNYFVARNVLKNYLSFFFVSLDITPANKESVKQEIYSIISKCDECGFLNNIEEDYRSINKTNTKISFDVTMMSQYVNEYIDNFDKYPAEKLSIGVLDELMKNNKMINCGQITTLNELKEKYLQNWNIIVEPIVDTPTEPVVETMTVDNTDKKLELFLSCIKGKDSQMHDRIKECCPTYESLNTFIRENNISEDIQNVIRIIDRDGILPRPDILQSAKALEEDPSVTETRNTFPIDTPKIDKPVFEEVISGLGIDGL